jgi:hypothetical protein
MTADLATPTPFDHQPGDAGTIKTGMKRPKTTHLVRRDIFVKPKSASIVPLANRKMSFA